MRRSRRRLIVFMLMASLAVYLYDRMRVSDVISLSQMGIYSLDIQDRDVIVLLDIQATGMTSLSRALMHDLVTDASCFCPPMRSRCSCRNSNGNPWLFNAYNATGWVCGEHADFTTLTKCPIDYWFERVSHDNRDYRRYAMMTLLREPAARFISEWRHLVEEDTFYKNEPRLFRNESLELQKKRLPCLLGVKVSEVSMEQFLECKDNPAFNRQTRMLANLTEVNQHGYHGDRYNTLLLASAIETLESLPFFGVYDRPSDTQMLLEMTLGLHFSRPVRLDPDGEYPSVNSKDFSGPMLRRLRLANHLDVRLYNHALFLFQSRVRAVTNPRLDDVIPQSRNTEQVGPDVKDGKMLPSSVMLRDTDKDGKFDKKANDRTNIVIETKRDEDDGDDVHRVENDRHNDNDDDKTINSKSVSGSVKREGDFDNEELLKFIDSIKQGKMIDARKRESSRVIDEGTGGEKQRSSWDSQSYEDRPGVGGMLKEFERLSMEYENTDKSAKSDNLVNSVDESDDGDSENMEFNTFLRDTEDSGKMFENSFEQNGKESLLKSADGENGNSYGQNWLKSKHSNNLDGVEYDNERNKNSRYLEASPKAFHDQLQPPAINKAQDERRGLETGFRDEKIQNSASKPKTFHSDQLADDKQFPKDTEDVDTFLSHLFHLKQQKQEQFRTQQQQQQIPHQQYQRQRLWQQQQPQQPSHEQQQIQHQLHWQQQQQQQQQQYQQQQQQRQHEIQQQYLPAKERTSTAGSSPMGSLSNRANQQQPASYSNVNFQEKAMSGLSRSVPRTSSESKFEEMRALDIANVQRMFV